MAIANAVAGHLTLVGAVRERLVTRGLEPSREDHERAGTPGFYGSQLVDSRRIIERLRPTRTGQTVRPLAVIQVQWSGR